MDGSHTPKIEVGSQIRDGSSDGFPTHVEQVDKGVEYGGGTINMAGETPEYYPTVTGDEGAILKTTSTQPPVSVVPQPYLDQNPEVNTAGQAAPNFTSDSSDPYSADAWNSTQMLIS